MIFSVRETHSKLWATVEVCLCFALIVWIFNFIRGTPLATWESGISPASRYFFVEYGVTLVGVLLLLVLTRKDLAKYGIPRDNYQSHFHVIAMGLLPMLMLGRVLGMVDWKTWSGALMVLGFEIIMLITVGWLLRKKAVAGTLIGIVAMVSIAFAWQGVGDGKLRGILIKTIYQYLFVGPAEEMLFRSYIQTRLNEVLGKPHVFFGVKWGWGIVIASFLFGLWHVIPNPSLPHVWPHCLWTIGLGLVLGYFREKSEGILVPSILHSVVNYVPIFDMLS